VYEKNDGRSYTKQNGVRNSDVQLAKPGTWSVSPSISSEELLLASCVPQCEKGLN